MAQIAGMRFSMNSARDHAQRLFLLFRLPDPCSQSSPLLSQADLSLPNKAFRRKFPLFPVRPGTSIDVMVEAGQMLYLPAGMLMGFF